MDCKNRGELCSKTDKMIMQVMEISNEIVKVSLKLLDLIDIYRLGKGPEQKKPRPLLIRFREENIL